MTISTRGILATAALVSLTSVAAAQEGTVTIYTSNPVQAVETIEAVARDNAPGLTFNTITGGSGVLLRRIEAESEQVQADFFWSSSANTLGAFEEVFEAYDSEHLAAIPEALHYPGNLFSPTNVHVVVMMVNEDQLGDLPMPETWSDLLDPAFEGRIVLPEPANSSTGYTIIWGVEQMLGTEALDQLARNVVITGTSQGVPRGVAQGEYAVGLTFESSAYPYVDGGQEEIKLVYPSDGTFITPEYLGLAKGAPGGEAAHAAIDLMLSQEAQSALLQASFRRPSRGDIEVSQFVDLPEMGDIAVFEIDENEAAAARDEFLQRWQSLGAATDE